MELFAHSIELLLLLLLEKEVKWREKEREKSSCKKRGKTTAKRKIARLVRALSMPTTGQHKLQHFVGWAFLPHFKRRVRKKQQQKQTRCRRRRKRGKKRKNSTKFHHHQCLHLPLNLLSFAKWMANGEAVNLHQQLQMRKRKKEREKKIQQPFCSFFFLSTIFPSYCSN